MLVLQPNTIAHLINVFDIAVTFVGLICGLIVALIFTVSFSGSND